MYTGDGDSDHLFSVSCQWLSLAGLCRQPYKHVQIWLYSAVVCLFMHLSLTALLSWRLSAVASGSARSAEISSLLRWSTTATVRTSPSRKISHLLTEGYVRLAVIHIPVHDALQQWSLVVLFLWSFLCLRREFPNWFTQSLSPIKL